MNSHPALTIEHFSVVELLDIAKQKNSNRMNELLSLLHVSHVRISAIQKSFDTKDSTQDRYEIALRVMTEIISSNTTHSQDIITHLKAIIELEKDTDFSNQWHLHRLNHVLMEPVGRLTLEELESIPLAGTKIPAFITNVAFRYLWLNDLSQTHRPLTDNELIFFLDKCERTIDSHSTITTYQHLATGVDITLDTLEAKMRHHPHHMVVAKSILNDTTPPIQAEEATASFCTIANILYFARSNLAPPIDEALKLMNAFDDIARSWMSQDECFLYEGTTFEEYALLYSEAKKIDNVFGHTLVQLMKSRGLPGTPRPKQRNMITYINNYPKNTRKEALYYDSLLLNFTLQHHFDTFDNEKSRKLLMLMLSLMTPDQTDTEIFAFRNQNEDGDLLFAEPYEIVRQYVFTKGKSQVNALHNIFCRWKRETEHDKNNPTWMELGSLDLVNEHALQNFYESAIYTLTNHDKFNNEQLAERLTNAVYDHMSLHSPTLKFFKAYYSSDVELKKTLYRDAIQMFCGYKEAAKNNLTLLLIGSGELNEAKEIIDTIADDITKKELQSTLDTKIKKNIVTEKLLQLAKKPMKLDELTDEQLIHLTAWVTSANNQRKNFIKLGESSFARTMSGTRTCRDNLQTLTLQGVLTPQKGQSSDLNPDNLPFYTASYLKLIPNVIGYFDIPSFLLLLRDRVKLISNESDGFIRCENTLKEGWLTGTLDYEARKRGYNPEDIQFTEQQQSEILNILSIYSSSEINAIVWLSLNHVDGSAKAYPLNYDQRISRIPTRITKALCEIYTNGYKGQTFDRNDKLPSLALEETLSLIDGLSARERFSSKYTRLPNQAENK